MAVRSVGIASATCPGLVGQGKSDVCRFRYGNMFRFLVKLQGTTNPFNTTTALITTESVWDTFLALTDSDGNNAYYSPALFNSTRTGGEPIITDNTTTGGAIVNRYADSQFPFSFVDQTKENVNNLVATIRDNANALEFIYINVDGDVVHTVDAAGAPQWCPINLAVIQEMTNEGGLDSPESYNGYFRVREELTVPFTKTALSFNIKAKFQ